MVTKWPPDVWMGVVDPWGRRIPGIWMGDGETGYAGPGPGEWKDKNPDPDELFDIDD